jgi:hypothetical protein
MSLEGERDDREPPAASGSWPRAFWTRTEEFAQYRCAGQRAVRHEDNAAAWVPGELPPPLPAAETRARKPRTSKKWDREILLGIWAILCVALSALVSLIERDRPDLLSSGNPFVVGVICASVVTVLFFGFAWLSEKA